MVSYGFTASKGKWKVLVMVLTKDILSDMQGPNTTYDSTRVASA